MSKIGGALGAPVNSSRDSAATDRRYNTEANANLDWNTREFKEKSGGSLPAQNGVNAGLYALCESRYCLLTLKARDMTTKINVPIEDRTMTRKTILLVEDNRDDELLTIRALRKSNVMNEVVVAHDGEEALNHLFGQPSVGEHESDLLPTVVLLDLKLPKIGGIEVLRQIRANPRTRRLPVVVLTSSKEGRDLDEVYDLGANSYIHKPVDFDKFADAIGHLGMYWVLFNEMPTCRSAPSEIGAV